MTKKNSLFTDFPKNKIAILGGGVAGAATAIHLARMGYSVTLFEREKEPHHKVCGEFLSEEALVFLDELNIPLVSIGPEAYRRFQLHSAFGALEVPFPFKSLGLSRKALDALLLSEAEKSGAIILRGSPVSHFEWEGSSCTFKIKTKEQTHLSQVLFLATGKHPLKNLHPRFGKESKNIAYKMHFKLSTENTALLAEKVCLFAFAGGYAGLSLVENKIANLAFIVQQSLTRKIGSSFIIILDHLKSSQKILSQYLKDATPLWPQALTLSGIPYGFLESAVSKSDFSPPLYYVGDQLAVIPSFTGTGISMALWSAKKAALAFHEGDTPEDYHETCRRELKSRMTFCFRLHRFLQIPWIAALGVLTFKVNPSLLQRLFQKTRCQDVPYTQNIITGHEKIGKNTEKSSQ